MQADGQLEKEGRNSIHYIRFVQLSDKQCLILSHKWKCEKVMEEVTAPAGSSGMRVLKEPLLSDQPCRQSTGRPWSGPQTRALISPQGTDTLSSDTARTPPVTLQTATHWVWVGVLGTDIISLTCLFHCCHCQMSDTFQCLNHPTHNTTVTHLSCAIKLVLKSLNLYWNCSL